MVDYATVPELKAMRRATKPGDDGMYARVLTAASRQIDGKAGRRFWLDATPSARMYGLRGRVVGSLDGERLLVDDIGSADGMTVEVGSGTSWVPATYETEPENALVRGQAITTLLRTSGYWGSYGSLQRVRITARWGWPEVPADVKEATLLLANRLLLRKDSPEGLAGSGDWGAIRLSRWDPDVEALLNPYVLPGIA